MSTFNEKKYKKLLAEALPGAIRTEEESERLLAITERLGRKEDAEGLTPEEERLFDLLATLVDDYETRQYDKQPRKTTPLEELQLCMENRGLKHKDIWPLFGSKGVASEVLNGKRQISKTHAHKLAEFFHVGVEFFV